MSIDICKEKILKKHKPLILEKFLPYRISFLSNTVSGAVARTYQYKFGLSVPEWRIVCILAEYPGVTADDICKRTQIEKSVVSRAVSRLFRQRVLKREIDKEDKRRFRLFLSDKGFSVYEKVIPVAIDYEERLISKLTQKERQSLDSILKKLQKEADELSLK